ncbi:MAG: hypothetical protein N3H31_00640 [Candidatus Nezhaarchaeota archaeon]|nr:hypothetical protein [Candidatus Nezhaarchaeota archaeon]
MNPKELIHLPVVKESPLYEKVRGRVKCLVCARGCLIPECAVGFCRTRMNIDGRLYTITYGDISAVESRPIES